MHAADGALDPVGRAKRVWTATKVESSGPCQKAEPRPPVAHWQVSHAGAVGRGLALGGTGVPERRSLEAWIRRRRHVRLC